MLHIYFPSWWDYTVVMHLVICAFILFSFPPPLSVAGAIRPGPCLDHIRMGNWLENSWLYWNVENSRSCPPTSRSRESRRGSSTINLYLSEETPSIYRDVLYNLCKYTTHPARTDHHPNSILCIVRIGYETTRKWSSRLSKRGSTLTPMVLYEVYTRLAVSHPLH